MPTNTPLSAWKGVDPGAGDIWRNYGLSPTVGLQFLSYIQPTAQHVPQAGTLPPDNRKWELAKIKAFVRGETRQAGKAGDPPKQLLQKNTATCSCLARTF